MKVTLEIYTSYQYLCCSGDVSFRLTKCILYNINVFCTTLEHKKLIISHAIFCWQKHSFNCDALMFPKFICAMQSSRRKCKYTASWEVVLLKLFCFILMIFQQYLGQNFIRFLYANSRLKFKTCFLFLTFFQGFMKRVSQKDFCLLKHVD